jgi:SAM-dependent methyltransferase
MSFFETAAVAQGYAKDRPYFHPEVIGKVRDHIGVSGKLRRALDVGCGAGLSTLALLEIAEKVVGVDVSEAMVSAAVLHADIQYCNYPAENLPFDVKFELITLAGAINWVQRADFFAEAQRILSPGGHVVIYDNNIVGRMRGNEHFQAWYENVYLTRYPRHPRDESPIGAAEAVGYGFEFVDSEDYTNEIEFTLEAFVGYILTQSNTTTVLRNGTEDAESMRRFFAASLPPFFKAARETLLFGGYIWYLRKI